MILRSHGYLGPGSTTPPRAEELEKFLVELESKGMAGSCASPDLLEDIEAWALTDDMAEWGSRLPATLQMAAPEIYRNITDGTKNGQFCQAAVIILRGKCLSQTCFFFFGVFCC